MRNKPVYSVKGLHTSYLSNLTSIRALYSNNQLLICNMKSLAFETSIFLIQPVDTMAAALNRIKSCVAVLKKAANVYYSIWANEA